MRKDTVMVRFKGGGWQSLPADGEVDGEILHASCCDEVMDNASVPTDNRKLEPLIVSETSQ